MKNFFGEPRSRIIFAADMTTLDDNCRVLDKCADQVDVVKINVPLVLRETPDVVRQLKERFGLPIFADMKVADVPHTCRGIISVMKDAGADAVMVHGIVGPDALQDCVDAASGSLGIIVQLELTHPGGLMFTQGIAEDMAAAATTVDVFGFQAPGNRPDRIHAIRSLVGPTPVIVCCGVGAQGGVHHKVLAAGGDYAIIGRAIYNSPDPCSAIKALTAGPA